MHLRAPAYGLPQPNPVGATAIIVSSLLAAVGVAGFVAGVRAKRPTEPGKEGVGEPPPPPRPPRIPPGMANAFVALATGGGAGQTTEEDIEIMMGGAHGGQFTSWFTREVEREIVSRFEDYRSKFKIEYCTPVQSVVIDPTFGAQKFTKWLSHAEPATRKVLEDLYPNGAPWHGNQFLVVERFSQFEEQPNGAVMSDTDPPIALWRYWLWLRVLNLADRHVCDFIPVT